MSKRTMIEILGTGAVAAAVGLTTWLVTMASAERYSYGAEQDMGNPAFYPILVGAAIIGGFVVPRRATLVGLALGAPGLLLSPSTAPRGDNDGLWILIVPYLAVFILVLVTAAWLGRGARAAIRHFRPDDQSLS